MTTNPIAGNQYYSGVSNAAEQFSNLNTSDLNVSNSLTLGGGAQFALNTLQNVAQMQDLKASDPNLQMIPTLSQVSSLHLPAAKVGLYFRFLVAALSSGGNDLEITANSGDEQVCGFINEPAGVQSVQAPSVGMLVGAGAPVGTCLAFRCVAVTQPGTPAVCWMLDADCTVDATLTPL